MKTVNPSEDYVWKRDLMIRDLKKGVAPLR